MYAHAYFVYAHDIPPRVQHFSAFQILSWCIYAKKIYSICSGREGERIERILTHRLNNLLPAVSDSMANMEFSHDRMKAGRTVI